MKAFTYFVFSAIYCLFIFPYQALAQTTNDALLLEYYEGQHYLEALAYLKGIYKDPVTDPVALRNLAYTSLMAGKLVEAEDFYQRLYNTDTTKLTILNSLAGINLRRGNIRKAGLYYKRIVDVDTANFYVLVQLANISLQTNDTVNCIKYLTKANSVNPVDADVASDLSDWLVFGKKFTQAEEVLNKATAADPENVVLLKSLIKLTHAQLKWPETIKIGVQLQKLGDGSYPTAIKLAQAYYMLKNYTCCLETLAAIESIQQNETSYYYTAMSFKALKRYPQAINYFEKAITDGISPSIPTYYGEIAGSYQRTKKFQKAVLAYQKGLTFNERPLLLYSIATLYDSDLKNKAKAVKYYKKYLSTNPPVKQKVYIDYTQSRLTELTGNN